MPLLIPNDSDFLREALPHRVYLRQNWEDPWFLSAHLYCNWCSFGCGEEPSKCELEWRYGLGTPAGTYTEDTFDRLDRRDWYVKVEIDQPDDGDPILWHGIVTEQGDRQFGSQAGASYTSIPSGRQTMIAHGLELLLDRDPVRTSWYKNDPASAVFEVRRGLQFNADHDFLDPAKTPEERSGDRYGNRSQYPDDAGVYLFAAVDLAHANKWSTYSILAYLLTYHPPQNASGEDVLQFGLTEEAIAQAPLWDTPIVKTDGKTIAKVLNELCDRRRLLMWRVLVDEETNRPKLDVRTFADAEFALPGGGTYKANTDTVALVYDLAVDVLDATIKASATHLVEQVVCRSARKRACFTISALDGTLVADWKDDDETAFEEGPPGLSGDFAAKLARLTDWRREDRFERVYTHFRIPADWDLLIGDGCGGQKFVAFPSDEDYGAEVLYMPGLRFCRHLPVGLLETAPGSSPEHWPKAAAWLLIDPDNNRYQHVERLGGNLGLAFSEGSSYVETSYFEGSCSLQVQHAAPGIIIKATGGRTHGQEAIAKTDFAPLTDLDPPNDVSMLDWQNNLIATVMMELDSHVEAVWPANEDLAPLSNDAIRRVLVDFGDRYRLDYVAPGTVSGVSDGILQRVSGGTYYRDDRDQLRNAARTVYEWYSQERKALSLTIRQVLKLVDVGQLITTIGPEDDRIQINSVVTSVHYDLVGGKTTITTAFAELDILQL